MPFEYRPFVNPYVSSMSDLMGRGVEARSRAELSAAEAQAGAAGRLGDITAAKWSGLGDTLAGGIDAYVTEQREKPMREHALWQMEQDKVAAARAGVEAERADVTYGLEQEELEYGKRYDKIINDGELAMGADPENKEAHRAAVREAIAQAGLPASYLNDYDELLQAADTHESAMLLAQAQIEAANARGASDAAIREHAEERQRYFEKIQSTREEFGDNSPENRAARNDYFLFTGDEDPRIAIQERQRDRDAAAAQAAARTSTEIARDRTFLIANYKGALESRDPAVIHAAEQALYQERIDPRTVRQSALKESYDEAIDRHNARVGTPGGMYGAAGREEMSDFDTWMRTADLPDVSTLGSVYAPPPPIEPPLVEGAITERELAADVERYDLPSMEEAAADYRNRGIDVVKDDGSPSWLGLNKPPPRTTDIPLPASSISERPIVAPDVSEPGTQWGRQRRRLTEWGRTMGDVARAAGETGAAIARTPLLMDRPLARPPRPKAR
jgi:hypothetical protein|tara:strand:- start:452 stop:1957 length:1506 start_codon:yes stop_codon:yes gene_type:complete